MLATVYVTSFALAFFAAAGMITFTSENRSTPLRICMLVQQAAVDRMDGLCLDSIRFPSRSVIDHGHVGRHLLVLRWARCSRPRRPEMSRARATPLADHVVGACVSHVAESGPATGYMFVVANATAIGIMCILGMIVGSQLQERRRVAGPAERNCFI